MGVPPPGPIPEASAATPVPPTLPGAHRLELVAPAGSPAAGYAALYHGAEAVYLGLKSFSARADADNFTPEEVDALTAFAHAQTPPRRVLAALNTLVLQHELPALVRALGALAEIGVDALIVQDLALVYLVRRHFPGLALHASTQMAVHHRAGLETLRALGFKRAVLARELVLDEIQAAAQTPGLETEVFVHGSLCYSYSGLCFFSALTDGRSGNRGKCNYSCRDRFTARGAPATRRDGTPVPRDPRSGFAFSMKDLALAGHLEELRAAGVTAVKLEGRKKSPLYVAAAVSYYRMLLDGRGTPADRRAQEEDLRTIFSRPWTSLYFRSCHEKEVAERSGTGHRGVFLGQAEKPAREARTGQWWFRLRTARRLELHDGLQVDQEGAPPYGFALTRLRRLDGPRPETVCVAPAGALVAVALPPDAPPVAPGAAVYCSSSQAAKQRYTFPQPKSGAYRVRQPFSLDARLAPEELRLEARLQPPAPGAQPLSVQLTLPGPFAPARDPRQTAAACAAAFARLGATRLALSACRLDNPQGLFVPVATWHASRRRLAEELEAGLAQDYAKRLEAALATAAPAAPAGPAAPLEAEWSVKIERSEYLRDWTAADWEGVAEVILEIGRTPAAEARAARERLAAHLGRERIRLALPLLTRQWEEREVRRQTESALAAGWRRWELSNLSGWRFLAPSGTFPSGLDLSAGWPLYATNRLAVRQLLELGATRFTCSPEDGFENIRSLLAEFPSQAVLPVHQDTPYFISESCAYANLSGGCPGPANCRFTTMELTSSYGERLLAVNDRCRTLVLNQSTFCLAPHLEQLRAAGARHFRADFLYRPYTPAEVRARWRLVRSGGQVPGGQTARFFRGGME